MGRFAIVCAAVLLAMSSVSFAQQQQKQKRLGYQQEQALKDARYYLDQVEGTAEAINQRLAPMKVGDPSVQIQDVRNLIANKERLDGYMNNTATRLKQLPADNPDVLEEQKRYASLTRTLADMDQKLKALDQSLSNVVNQGATAEYKADFDRLRDINQMFSNPGILEQQPQRAIEIIKQIPAVKDERARIQQKYAALLQQSTPQARDMNGVLRYFDEQFGAFNAAVEQYAKNAPAAISADIDEAMKMGDDAVANKKHLFFGEGGGVAQRLGWAETKTSVLAAISPEGADTKAAQEKLAEARNRVQSMKASLIDSIIANNRPPQLRYNGGDKDQLIAIIKEKWANEGNGGEVLVVGVNSSDWERDVRWEWNNSGWYKVDVSRIQGHVIVKSSDTEAVVHYVNLVKNHLKNDRITSGFLSDPKETPDPINRLLLSNVK